MAWALGLRTIPQMGTKVQREFSPIIPKCLWAHKIRDVDFSFILLPSTTLSWKTVCGCYNLFDLLHLLTVFCLSSCFSCVELIVVEQMNKYKARLKDISSLEFAENKAKTRLSLIRRSMVSCTTWNHGKMGAFLRLKCAFMVERKIILWIFFT